MKLRFIAGLSRLLSVLSMITVLVSCSGEKSRTVDAVLLLDFGKVKSGVNLNDAYLPNSYCFDDEGKIYILDYSNHRVIKLDMEGNLVKQIGNIGQGEGDLFNPRGIFTSGKELYILNKNGNEVKRFTLDGEFLSRFKLEGKAPQAQSFFVWKGLIYINQIEETNSDGKLICVYSPEGKLIKKIGKGYVVCNYAANLAFNNAYMVISNDILYGCFPATTPLFKIRLDNDDVSIKKLEFREFLDIEKNGKQTGVKPPEYFSDKSVASVKRVGFVIYTYGITVGKENDILLYSNVDKGRRGIIFRLDSEGKLKERISIRFQGRIPRIVKIFSMKNEGFIALLDVDRALRLAKIDI